MKISPQVRSLIQLALEEDWGRGDWTAFAVPAEKVAHARVIAREDTVASGLHLIEAVLFEAGIRAEELSIFVKNGDPLTPNQEVFRVRASARELLGVERTLLNFLQRTFGVAMLAQRFKKAVENEGLKVRVTDTRKTLPGWRVLDKEAVRDGGLRNHRYGLDSGVLLKENHLRAAGGIKQAVQNLSGQVPHGMQIQCEVTSFEEAVMAINAGVSVLLLDNFSVEELARVVPLLRERQKNLILEYSGNLRLDTIAAYARTGVDILSVGALTHSAPAANLSMLFEF